MRRHGKFEWDGAKARTNARKHRVSFTQAMRVLGDPEASACHVEEYDDEHSLDEDRYVTTGSDPYARDVVLVIAWTDRDGVTRIISARPATRAERNEYEAAIQSRQDGPEDGG